MLKCLKIIAGTTQSDGTNSDNLERNVGFPKTSFLGQYFLFYI